MDDVYLSFDIGEKRIGVAKANAGVAIAWPLTTIIVDGKQQQGIRRLIDENNAKAVVVGRPINQSGLTTAQTKTVEKFVETTIKPLGLKIYWQDESVTSVIAEDHLKRLGKPYERSDIDAMAAAVILQDFLENAR